MTTSFTPYLKTVYALPWVCDKVTRNRQEIRSTGWDPFFGGNPCWELDFKLEIGSWSEIEVSICSQTAQKVSPIFLPRSISLDEDVVANVFLHFLTFDRFNLFSGKTVNLKTFKLSSIMKLSVQGQGVFHFHFFCPGSTRIRQLTVVSGELDAGGSRE